MPRRLGGKCGGIEGRSNRANGPRWSRCPQTAGRDFTEGTREQTGRCVLLRKRTGNFQIRRLDRAGEDQSRKFMLCKRLHKGLFADVSSENSADAWCWSKNEPAPDISDARGGSDLDRPVQRRRRPVSPARPSRTTTPGAGMLKLAVANCTAEPATPSL